jgi:2-iminobutanoate/2-iminopropanoate deaminase
MSNRVIVTSEAPAPIGPYSQAVRAGNLLFISGQIALLPESNLFLSGSISEETHQVMKNLQAILKVEGADFSKVVKTSIFLSDMGFFPEMNEVYAQYFSGVFPARETIAVKELPKKANVEISMIASL